MVADTAVPPQSDAVPAQPIEASDEEEESPSLIIPITSSNDKNLFIELFPDEVAATPASTLLQVLRDETADVSTWADAGLCYMQQKQARESLTVLEEACEQHLDDKQARVRCLAATGIAHLAVTENQTSSNTSKRLLDPKEEGRQQADQKFTQAGKVDALFPMTWTGRGMLNLSQGRLEQARFFFDTTLKQCGPVLPALLGMAAVQFGEGQYGLALKQYETAIRQYPVSSGAPARVGFGLACYKLGQVDRAKAAFSRALALDAENVQAMVGASILDLANSNSDSAEYSARTERAIKMLSMANLIHHANAMVQNHLANHYFWKWTPVTGTVTLTQGSKLVQASAAMSLEPGERIRIGTRFETVVALDEEEDDDEGMQFRIQDAWKEPSAAGLKVWKKDYDRVIALAKGAYGSTSVAEIQAESLFFLARVYHVRKEHDNALKFYERACKLAPDLVPARFGLAQTLVVKEDYKAAMDHLKQVLRASPSATDALSLMGLLKVRTGKDVEEGLALLRKAAELDPLNPDLVVLEALALQQHKANYNKAIERYQKAVELTRRKRGAKVPYDVLVNTGVLCHETKRFDEALNMYKQALKALDESGLSRVATLDNVGVDGGRIRHPDSAIFCGFCDSELEVEPVEIDEKSLLKVVNKSEADLPSLVVTTGDQIQLNDDFESEIVSVTAKDGSILIELKEAFVPMETSTEEEKTPIPLFVKRENTLLKIPEAMTVAFNLACLHEAMGRSVAAIELHKAILKRNPNYVNSYLRLACIAVDSGSLKECSEWLKIAAASAPGNAEVLVLVGNLHLSLCDWQPAQTVFDGLIANKVSSVEAYASLSLGNIYFANLHVAGNKRYAKHLTYASDYYRRILAKDPSNAYAANGLGTILAEKAEIFKAKEVFNRVREVSGDTIADALLNLGHIFLAQKKHPEALQMYKSYMKRAEDSTTPITSKSRVDDVVDVLLYIAFAYFDWARHTELFNDANAAPADGRYKQAMENLELAISKHTKKEVVLKYNLCMTKLQAANCVLQKLTRNIQRTVEEVEEALTGLQKSLATVEQIIEDKQDPQKKIPIPSSTLQDFVRLCRANITSAESHLEDEKKRAEEMATERRFRQVEAEEAMKQEALKQMILKEEEAKKQEERDRKAEAKMKQVEQLRAGWQQEQEQKQAEKEKRAQKKGGESKEPGVDVEEEPPATHGLFDDSDEDSDEEPEKTEDDNKAPDDDKAKTTTNDLFGDSDEDEDDDAVMGESAPTEAKASSGKDLFGDSDEDEEGDGDRKESGDSTPAEAKKATNADLFGDSDEEESDEELVRPEAKRKTDETEDAEGDQPQKKRRLVEDEEDEEAE